MGQDEEEIGLTSQASGYLQRNRLTVSIPIVAIRHLPQDDVSRCGGVINCVCSQADDHVFFMHIPRPLGVVSRCLPLIIQQRLAIGRCSLLHSRPKSLGPTPSRIAGHLSPLPGHSSGEVGPSSASSGFRSLRPPPLAARKRQALRILNHIRSNTTHRRSTTMISTAMACDTTTNSLSSFSLVNGHSDSQPWKQSHNVKSPALAHSFVLDNNITFSAFKFVCRCGRNKTFSFILRSRPPSVHG
ncbi:hypothetical protein N657DRAFT_499803 [Parathielavia appendiculata]|uniref:Uncharacterized protein n=1 Tax=Parathielavia appendiculata TaxID=2587402 RepID=A0AAN6TY06_9PEZI|nr:hypothetical protein N657DRAFT_499803 [Parathielavia appendiculata]